MKDFRLTLHSQSICSRIVPAGTRITNSGRAPWADSARADCPGFLVFGAAGARPPSFVQELQGVSLD